MPGPGGADEPRAGDRQRRSVGELLIDSDHLARAVLADGSVVDCARIVRSWPHVVEAAAAVWQAVQPYHRGAVPDEMTRAVQANRIERVLAAGAGSARPVRPGRWPGSGPGEDRFDQIAANLATAARLVAAGGPAVRAQRPDLRGDVLAAMTRLIHVTYVAAHAVEVALLAERDAVRQRSRRPAPPGLSMPSDAQLTERITQIRVVQDGARAVLGSSWPAALTGAHHEPVPVAVALAAWDAQAYRTLTTTADTGDLVLATQTTTTFLHLGGLVLAAAAETGDIPPQTYRRLLPALTAAQDAWSGLAAAWADLVPPGYRGVDADLAAAAATTRTALTGLALDGATPATADRMATRADLPHAAAAVADSLIGAANLADAIGHATAHAPIQAPARRVTGLHRRVHGPETDLPVDPTDHIFNHVVDLPDATRALLAGLSRRAALTTAATLRSAGPLTTPAPHHHRRPGPGDIAPATAEHHRRSEPAPAQALTLPAHTPTPARTRATPSRTRARTIHGPTR